MKRSLNEKIVGFGGGYRGKNQSGAKTIKYKNGFPRWSTFAEKAARGWHPLTLGV